MNWSRVHSNYSFEGRTKRIRIHRTHRGGTIESFSCLSLPQWLESLNLLLFFERWWIAASDDQSLCRMRTARHFYRMIGLLCSSLFIDCSMLRWVRWTLVADGLMWQMKSGPKITTQVSRPADNFPKGLLLVGSPRSNRSTLLCITCQGCANR